MAEEQPVSLATRTAGAVTLPEGSGALPVPVEIQFVEGQVNLKLETATGHPAQVQLRSQLVPDEPVAVAIEIGQPIVFRKDYRVTLAVFGHALGGLRVRGVSRIVACDTHPIKPAP